MDLYVSWPVILVVTVISVSVSSYIIWVVAKKKIDLTSVLFYNYHKNYDLLATSFLLSPLQLTFMRVIFAFYCLASLIATGIRLRSNMFAYYTIWNFMILTYYWWGSGYLSLIYYIHTKRLHDVDSPDSENSGCECPCTKMFHPVNPDEEAAVEINVTIAQKTNNNYNKNRSTNDNDKIKDEHIKCMFICNKVLRVFVWFVGSQQSAICLLVTIVVWAFLFPTSSPAERRELLVWDNISMHVLNVVMRYADFMVTEQPFQFHVLAFVLLIGLVYGFWSWIIREYIFHFWSYNFLNTTKFPDSIAYVVIELLHLILWIVVCYIVRLRNQKLLPLCGVDPNENNNNNNKNNGVQPQPNSLTDV